MPLTNTWNRLRYRLYAPVYDTVARPLERGRRRAIERLGPGPDDRILVVGCGTGVDLDYLPDRAAVTAVDLTPSMVRRTAARDDDVAAGVADAEALPFEDDVFDVVLLHLVLSVVPNPETVVAETERVLAPDGCVSIYDKFGPEQGDPSLLRRLANPPARVLFADLNRRLEPMVAPTSLVVDRRETFLCGLYTVTLARPTVDEYRGPV